MKRRDLLRLLGRSTMMAPFVSATTLTSAFATEPVIPLGDVQSLRRDDTIIVLIRLFGGNDGLNTLVPYTNPLYYKYRRDDSMTDLSKSPESVQPLGNHPSLGFHPNLKLFKTLYDEGKVAIVQNVGYPDQDFSHFRSTDIWLSASDAAIRDETGWIGRYVEYLYSQGEKLRIENPFAIEIATSRTRLTRAKNEDYTATYKFPVPIPDRDEHNRGVMSPSAVEQEYIRSIINSSNSFLQTFERAEAKAGKNLAAYPENSELATDLARVVRLIAGGAEARLYSIATTMLFDNHSDMIYHHDRGMTEIDGPIHAFQRELELRGLDKRVVTLIYSEFGRRVSGTLNGTDHGAAAPVFLLGTNVNGGVYGTDPDLEHLDPNTNLRYSIDFRSIYCTLLEQWYGEQPHLLSPMILPHKIDSLPLIRNTDSNRPIDVTCFPNPAVSESYIKCDVAFVSGFALFDANGRRCDVDAAPSGQRAMRVNCRALSSGMYYIVIIEAGVRRTGTLLVYK